MIGALSPGCTGNIHNTVLYKYIIKIATKDKISVRLVAKKDKMSLPEIFSGDKVAVGEK